MGGGQSQRGGGTRRVRLAGEARREQILRAAVEVFSTRPVDAVSLDDVAQAAGVTRALINHHFGTKRDPYVAAVEAVMRVVEVPVPDYQHGDTPESRLRAAMALLMRDLRVAPELWLAAIQAGGMGDAEVTAILDGAREEAVARFLAVFGLGAMQDLTDPEHAVLRGWEGFGEALLVQHLVHGRLTEEEAIELIVELGVSVHEKILRARETGTSVAHVEGRER